MDSFPRFLCGNSKHTHTHTDTHTDTHTHTHSTDTHTHTHNQSIKQSINQKGDVLGNRGFACETAWEVSVDPEQAVAISLFIIN